jgi:hypothetical protein
MILEAIFAVGTIILTELTKTSTAEFVRQWFQNKKFFGSKVSEFSSSKTTTDVTRELEIIDVEVIELEKKEWRDGYVSARDRERKEELEYLQADRFNQYQEIKEIEIAKEHTESPENHETSILKDNSAHILQYHMGQVVFEKKCKCGRPMLLQSQQRLDGSLYRLEDFYWSCTGYFNPPLLQCKKKQSFCADDAGFLHKANVLEFQITNQDLTRIFSDTLIQRAVVNRVKSHVSDKDEDTLCPVHLVPRVLKEKRENVGALDMFYLGCPHPGCSQVVKLKSPAQLAAYLDRKEGRGIL